MIRIENLSKKYKNSDRYAVNNLSLEVNDGEVFGFIGSNGAGKSTTIKCVTGILPFSEGKIEVAGFDLSKNSIEAKKNIGYVSDNHSVYDKLSGREYVNFLANVYGVSKELRDKRLNDLAVKFDLQDKLDIPIKSYSHGMKQKICVIGALIHEPKVWILDEPLTGLDPKSAKELKGLMREHCEKGNVVFFSSHVLEVVEKLCDRIAIIKNGQIIETFTMQELEEKQQGKSLEDFFLEITADKSEVEIPSDAIGSVKESEQSNVAEDNNEPEIEIEKDKVADYANDISDNSFADSVNEIVESFNSENNSKIDTNEENNDKNLKQPKSKKAE